MPAKLVRALLVPPPARGEIEADGRFPVGRNVSLGCWTFPVVSKGRILVCGAFAGLLFSISLFTGGGYVSVCIYMYKPYIYMYL